MSARMLCATLAKAGGRLQRCRENPCRVDGAVFRDLGVRTERAGSLHPPASLPGALGGR